MRQVLHVIAQHEFRRVGLHVGLLHHPWLRVAPEVMLEQGQRHNQGHESLPIRLNTRNEFFFIRRIEIFFRCPCR